MKTLLVGEGVHELGDHQDAGALATLVVRLAQTVRIEGVRFWKDESITPLHGIGGGGFRKKAIRWMIQARKEGFDAVVLLVDEDGDGARTRQLAEAQAVPEPQVARALGVAVRAFDAWMIADELALTAVLGRTVQTQPAPEGIGSPKKHMQELVGEGLTEDGLRLVYARIAQEARIDVLEKRCPRGFGTFAERVRALAPPA